MYWILKLFSKHSHLDYIFESRFDQERGKITGNISKICLLIPVTSRNQQWEKVGDSFLSRIALPSIAKTCEPNKYHYNIYIAFDVGDPFYDNVEILSALDQYVKEYISFANLVTRSFENEHKRPGPVMNFLSREAYNDWCDFMYQTDDDTELLTPWTSAFVDTLQSFAPSLRGVVGPTCHEENPSILIHDFVHRSHLDIFSTQYPPQLTDWHDDWITHVYGESNTRKLGNVIVKHHALVKRFEVRLESKDLFMSLLETGRLRISRWSKLKVIAYCLYGDNPRYMDGALANAKLILEFFPNWTMRVYHDNSVPEPVLRFLRELNTELVDMSNEHLKNRMVWRFLPAGEEDVERFISRDIDALLSAREAAAVREWEESELPFTVMRDHPSHSKFKVCGGMWGSKGGAIKDIRERLVASNLANEYMADMNFLNSQIWPLMSQMGVMVHDAFSCDWPATRPFSTPRQGSEHVGSVHIDGVVRQIDADILLNAIARGQPGCNDAPKSAALAPRAWVQDSAMKPAEAGTASLVTPPAHSAVDKDSRVCMLLPVSSRKQNWTRLEDTFLLRMPLSSLARTCEPDKFTYSLFVGYDVGDAFFDNPATIAALEQWVKANASFVTLEARPFVNELRKPGPIINHLSREAYNAGCDFMYRVNDDTEFLTPWTSAFVQALRDMSPPLRGVVGPTCNEGNTAILTHDFVHRSHLDIFPTHYPTDLTDWWLDDWSTHVYGEGNTRKLKEVVVKHHLASTRYEVDWESGKMLQSLVDKGRVTISRSLSLKVIAYSLYGNKLRFTDGALANAKLIAQYFPGWTMRVYHDRSVPELVLQQLRDHRVELIDMSGDLLCNQTVWRFLPAGEEGVERFISRDIDALLNAREAAAVREWEESGLPFSVMRDHPSHSRFKVCGGMWGSKGGAIKDIRERLVASNLTNEYMADMNFLNSKVWPLMSQMGVMVHDVVQPFKTPRQGAPVTNYVGTVYLNAAILHADISRHKPVIFGEGSVAQAC